MKDLGEISWFLGIQFKHDKDVIEMNQSRYIDKLIKRFNMQNCKERSTPCEMNVNKVVDDDCAELADVKLYREIVGSLIYVMTATRPDISYIVTKLSQHMVKPTITLLTMAKHVLRYLKSTNKQSLVFKKLKGSLSLTGYSDAD